MRGSFPWKALLSAEAGYNDFLCHDILVVKINPTSARQTFFRSPSGYFSNICSLIHSLEAWGVIFQPELHVDTISTTEVPLFCQGVFESRLQGVFVFLTAAGVCTA